MTETQNDRAERRLRMAVTAAVVMLSLLPLFAYVWKEQQLLRYEKALIGRIHRDFPEQEAELTALLYEKDRSTELMKSGEETLLFLGYTEKGLPILKRRISDRKEVLPVILIPAGVSVLLLLLISAVFRRMRVKERKSAQEIRALQDRIQKLSSLEQQNERLHAFTENIAHQIKTPLSRVMTSLELLPEDSRTDECIRHIEEIRRLIARLLSIGRLEAGEVLFTGQDFSLCEMLSELLSEYGEDSAPSLTLIPKNGSFSFSGDSEWLREAFRNLLDNAAKYGASEKSAELVLEEFPEEYRLTLRDYGPGFDEEDLPHLFDRFYRTKEMQKGHVGLGLHLARLIIEGHKGSIRAENHPDRGAVFTILLPRFITMKQQSFSL